MSAPPEGFAVVVPIVEGAAAAVAELLEAGPPFDPDETGLSRHEVFVSSDEVIFVFESRDGVESLEAMIAEPGADVVADAWQLHMAGPPRLARPAYVWERAPSAVDRALLPPGLRAG